MQTISSWLLALAIVFAAFVLARAASAKRRVRGKEAFPRYQGALEEARRVESKAEKAKLYRAAARVALDELELPGRATSLSRRADRLDPQAEEGIALLVEAMLAERRERALERLLWVKLSKEAPGSPRHERIFEGLLSLYEGALKDPERAEALRGMRRRMG